MVRELLDLPTAVKMVKREKEKFPEESIDELIDLYSKDWFDDKLTIEDKEKIKDRLISHLQ